MRGNLRADWEKEIDWHEIQRDGLTPYREMVRWRRYAVAGWLVAVACALGLAVVLQVLVAIR